MKSRDIITPSQIRAGRAILKWSQEELAEAARISIATIRKLEVEKISPRYTTLHPIKETLERAGLEFLEPDGVRRKPEGITIYEGLEGVDGFIGDIRQTVRKRGGDVLAIDAQNEKHEHNIFETLALVDSTLKIRCMSIAAPNAVSRANLEFRILPKHHLNTLPFYVYGEKYAIITFGLTAPDPRIIVVRSLATASAARSQFHALWERAAPIRLSSASI